MISVKGKTRFPLKPRMPHKSLRKAIFPTVLLAGIVGGCLSSGCGSPEQRAKDTRNSHRGPPLSEDRLDDCASRFADALRRWSVVENADAPVLLANPRWHNESAYPDKNGPATARELVEAINLRTGAKVRITPPGSFDCHYATELVLAQDTGAGRQPILVLTWRVLRPGEGRPLVEESVPIGRFTPTSKSKPGLSAKPVPESKATPGRQHALAGRSYHDIAFERGLVRLDSSLADKRVAILGERAWRDEKGRLCVELRLLSRSTKTDVNILAYCVKADGKRHAPAKPIARTLDKSTPTSIVATLPAVARSYEMLIVPGDKR